MHKHNLNLQFRNNWICNICGTRNNSDRSISFFCKECNFDVCVKCYDTKNNGEIKPLIYSDFSIHKDGFYYENNLNTQCTFCIEDINNMPGYRCRSCPIVLCINCSDFIFRSNKNRNDLHKHNLELKYCEDWICNLCLSDFDEATSFHCEDCDFDACYECYLKNFFINSDKSYYFS